MSKVSVLVPSFNQGRYLPLALESVLTQSHSDLEVIITDDCSTDGSRDIAEQWKRLDTRVRTVFHDVNRGLAVARNSALAVSSGDFVAFCDADDIWLPDKLRIQLESFRRDPDAGLAHSDAIVIDTEGNPTGQLISTTMQRKGQVTSGNVFEELCQRNFMCVPTVIVGRAAIDRVGRFDAQFRSLEDWVCWTKISKLYPFHYNREPLAKYRVHGASLSANSIAMSRCRTMACAALLAEFKDMPPRIRSNMFYTLGMSHSALGEFDEAKGAFRDSIKENFWQLRNWVRFAQASFKSMSAGGDMEAGKNQDSQLGTVKR